MEIEFHKKALEWFSNGNTSIDVNQAFIEVVTSNPDISEKRLMQLHADANSEGDHYNVKGVAYEVTSQHGIISFRNKANDQVNMSHAQSGLQNKTSNSSPTAASTTAFRANALASPRASNTPPATPTARAG